MGVRSGPGRMAHEGKQQGHKLDGDHKGDGEKTAYKVKAMLRGATVLAWDMPGEEHPTDEEVAAAIREKTGTFMS